MRTERDAVAAVDANRRLHSGFIHFNRANKTSLEAIAATDAGIRLEQNTAAFSFFQGVSGTNIRAGGIFAGVTNNNSKASLHPTD